MPWTLRCRWWHVGHGRRKNAPGEATHGGEAMASGHVYFRKIYMKINDKMIINIYIYILIHINPTNHGILLYCIPDRPKWLLTLMLNVKHEVFDASCCWSTVDPYWWHRGLKALHSHPKLPLVDVAHLQASLGFWGDEGISGLLEASLLSWKHKKWLLVDFHFKFVNYLYLEIKSSWTLQSGPCLHNFTYIFTIWPLETMPAGGSIGPLVLAMDDIPQGEESIGPAAIRRRFACGCGHWWDTRVSPANIVELGRH